jgi:hypothetical protein
MRHIYCCSLYQKRARWGASRFVLETYCDHKKRSTGKISSQNGPGSVGVIPTESPLRARGRKAVNHPQRRSESTRALREIRDLFGIGAEAESKLGAGLFDGQIELEALMPLARLGSRRAGASQSRATHSLGSQLKPKPTRNRPS